VGKVDAKVPAKHLVVGARRRQAGWLVLAFNARQSIVDGPEVAAAQSERICIDCRHLIGCQSVRKQSEPALEIVIGEFRANALEQREIRSGSAA
jgi:hypothetical protein